MWEPRLPPPGSHCKQRLIRQGWVGEVALQTQQALPLGGPKVAGNLCFLCLPLFYIFPAENIVRL